MNLHRDHVAGGAFVLVGALVLAVSSDLPFGTMASPGAGMLPKLIVGFLMAFGTVLFVRAADSPLLSTMAWTDAPHAVRVVVVAALAIGLYTTLGFVFTAGALLFVLTYLVERRPLLVSAAFSIGVTVLAYALFGLLLKTPLPRGIMGF